MGREPSAATPGGPNGRVGEIRARLLALIDQLPENAMLPPERDLALQWQVARMTLRRAMSELVTDGMLVRRQGAGTFTARPKVARRLVMTSFTEEMHRRGLRPGARVLDLRRRSADALASRQLRIPIGDPVLQITRLRLADDLPMAVENLLLPDCLVPGLTREDLTGSLYEQLADRFGLQLISGHCRLETTMPEARDARLLGIAQEQPCLSMRGVTLDIRGRVIERMHTLYRGDRFSLTVDLGRAGA